MSRVAQFVVEIARVVTASSESGSSLYRGLEFALRFLQIVVQAIQASEEQMVVHAVGFQADDLLILLDRQLQHALRTAAAWHVAE